jgi:hypothetical protein
MLWMVLGLLSLLVLGLMSLCVLGLISMLDFISLCGLTSVGLVSLSAGLLSSGALLGSWRVV